MNPEQYQLIRTRVENLFSPNYLFDPVHASWREMVASQAAETPPFIPCSMLLSFVDVTSLCSAGTDENNLQEIATACESSQVVIVKKNEVGKWVIRRRESLKSVEDPEQRTVFVKPVHFDATDADIKSFFGNFGEIERIERRTFFAGSAQQSKKPSVFIVFKTVNAATKCITGNPSYGSCGNALGDLFIPKLTVAMKSAHESQIAEEADREYVRNQKKQLVDAGKSSSSGAGGPDEAVKRFTNPGCVLKVSNVSASITWQDIKGKLGNLVLTNPNLKKQIVLVHIETSAKVAYIITKTPQAATDLVVAYQTQQNDAFGQEMRKVVPNLALPDANEQKIVVQKFPEWVGGKVNKKQEVNRKRDREGPLKE